MARVDKLAQHDIYTSSYQYVAVIMVAQTTARKRRMTEYRTLEAFREHGGVMQVREALAKGIHPATLYRLNEKGAIKPMARGLYGLADLPPFAQPDLVTISLKVPRAVICLLSALAFHGLTEEIPHTIDCAMPRGAEPPRLAYPPLRIYWFSTAAYAEGIAEHIVDGHTVRVYTPEKTLADCFKYRNKLGMDTVLDALRRYRAKYGLNSDELLRHARVCRVHNVMRPYLEALL